MPRLSPKNGFVSFTTKKLETNTKILRLCSSLDTAIWHLVLGAPRRHAAHHPNANFVDNRQPRGQLCPTKTKRKRIKFPRMNQKDSLWWRMFLVAPRELKWWWNQTIDSLPKFENSSIFLSMPYHATDHCTTKFHPTVRGHAATGFTGSSLISAILPTPNQWLCALLWMHVLGYS